jgi:hypothetical protein
MGVPGHASLLLRRWLLEQGHARRPRTTRAGYADFASTRTWRLLKPVLVLLAIWLPLATIAQYVGLLDTAVLRQATTVVTQPLWFIGIYLIVTALAPPMRALHQRFGARVLVSLVAGAIIVDVARFLGDASAIGYLNFGFVWLFAHQLGYFHADGTLVRFPARLLWAGAMGGLATLATLTRFGPYRSRWSVCLEKPFRT